MAAHEPIFLTTEDVIAIHDAELEVALLATASKRLDKAGLTAILRTLVILAKTDPAYYVAAHFRQVRGRPTPSQQDAIRD